jgi:bifunctional DNA-binding transcriptional regulator/antitoxin component of YhaV-PrlF toxin-antitoxin module
MMENACKPYEAKVVRHGTSLHVVVPSHIRKVYEIDEGDELEVQLIRKGGATRICTELEAVFA